MFDICLHLLQTARQTHQLRIPWGSDFEDGSPFSNILSSFLGIAPFHPLFTVMHKAQSSYCWSNFQIFYQDTSTSIQKLWVANRGHGGQLTQGLVDPLKGRCCAGTRHSLGGADKSTERLPGPSGLLHIHDSVGPMGKGLLCYTSPAGEMWCVLMYF